VVLERAGVRHADFRRLVQSAAEPTGGRRQRGTTSGAGAFLGLFFCPPPSTTARDAPQKVSECAERALASFRVTEIRIAL